MQRQVSMGEAVSMFFKNYANFSGRSSRSEYWWVVLFNAIIIFPIYFLIGIGSAIESTALIVCALILIFAYFLATLIPNIALTVRRLHDSGRGGGWYFIGFVPYIGGIWLLVLTCLESEPMANRFGPIPNDPDGEEEVNPNDVLI